MAKVNVIVTYTQSAEIEVPDELIEQLGTTIEAADIAEEKIIAIWEEYLEKNDVELSWGGTDYDVQKPDGVWENVISIS